MNMNLIIIYIMDITINYINMNMNLIIIYIMDINYCIYDKYEFNYYICDD
jgi:hypothetical protein